MAKLFLRAAFVLLVSIVFCSPWASSEQDETPAYNPAAPTKNAKLPPILSADQLWGENAQFAYQTHAYELAAKIQSVLYQQPCYCYCDRIGHKSLRSCFENSHGAQCSICLKELYYSYLMHQKGKSAEEIRRGITNGEWKQISLATAASIN